MSNNNDMNIIFCTACGHKNPETARQCEKCQRPFELPAKATATAHTPSPPPPAQSSQPTGIFVGIVDSVKQFISRKSPAGSRNPKKSAMMPGQQPATSPSAASKNTPTLKLSPNTTLDDSAPLPLLPAEQNIAGQYRILKSVKLDTCNYYEVSPLQSTQPDSSPQVTHLIRETAVRSYALSPEDFANLTGVEKLPFVLPHQEPIPVEGRAYTRIQYPGPWGTLAKIKVPVSPEKAFTWTEQIAQALAGLNSRGLGGFWFGKAGRETIFIVQGEARLADITFVRRIQEQSFAHDVHALASLLHYLLTGQELTPEAPHAPPQFRAVLRRAAGHGINSITEFMQELETSKQTPVYQRALRQTDGYFTHPGKVRDHNEDYVGVFQLALDQTGSAAPVGLYVVADGMGGQAAGEFASRGSVQQAFVQFINNQVLPELQRSTRRLDTATATTPKDQLENLVEVANKLVYKANQATNSDRGTTITAVLIIGSQSYIANVGDSRTYLLRNGQLRQLTQDHSLVYSLFLANQITEEEIYTHPRKNEVHRSLGDKAEVKVDTFAETLQPGDKLLLCSDGLWEMVRNPYIQQTLAGTASPQAICDHLIRMANDNGGEDNITAIVVALE